METPKVTHLLGNTHRQSGVQIMWELWHGSKVRLPKKIRKGKKDSLPVHYDFKKPMICVHS